jgi:hypothetical protein
MKLSVRAAEFHARQSDRDLFTKWAFGTDNNLFDPKVTFYPTTNVLAVEKEQDGGALEPIFFAPFQAVVMLESLAPSPGLSPREMAAALSKFHEGIVNVCLNLRIREIFFVCADDTITDFVLNHPFAVAGQTIRYKEINGEMVRWAKENGFKPSGDEGPIKRTLKLKLPGPEDKLPQIPASSTAK